MIQECIARFLSGTQEQVLFFPVEIINLKSLVKEKALQVDMIINPEKAKPVKLTAWVDPSEISELIIFIETYVIPNLDKKFRKQSSEYIFKAKEMTLSYRIKENRTRISIWLNDYDNELPLKYHFWTESQTNNISNLLDVLKKFE